MIVSSKNLYLTGALLFCVSGAIQADVPYVFQEGDTIRADEINENFRHFDSEVGTLSGDVESGANSAVPDEDYTYNQKNLTVGRDKLTVLGRSYDIVAIDTLSFKDHDLFTIKFPIDFSIERLPTTRELRYDDQFNYTDRISGYPARISVSVGQAHNQSTINPFELTAAEYDELEWDRHHFHWNSSNELTLTITATHRNYRITCSPLVQAQGDFPGNFSWNAVTNQSYRATYYGMEYYILSDIPDVKSSLSTAIDTCIADSKADRQDRWRQALYRTTLDLSINVQILLDDATIFSRYFKFDSYTIEADLLNSCKPFGYSFKDGWGSCGAEVAELQRDFSSVIDQQNTLARKSRREEVVKELFTLLDHIVISEAAEN